ncbi:MAG: ChaN family lipoprotein, partial [Candidatus Rokuibacteriota bacterium]
VPDASIASVAFVEVDAAAEKPGEYAKRIGSDALPFDYVWFTPKVDDDDPCEKLRKSTETEKIGR